MKYIIFSFELGDYVCDENNHILVFASRGLACQYMQENYRKPVPVQKTKRMIHYPKCYQAPFKLQKVC
ncbi:hypothetical protein [Streptococcus hyointestinalis]|nr:hypothetical protein [Streptococcus hyointestinalis]